MKFSVLISLYAKERPEFLWQSLESVFNQSLSPDEVIVVEDGPLTPELYVVLEEFEKEHPEFHRIKLPENGGLGKALNEGLKHCHYDLVARMDTDDIAKSDRFAKQIAIFEVNPEIQVVSSWISEFRDTPTNIISVRKLPEFPFELYAYGKKRCPVNHPAVMFRKSSVLLAGGYRHFPLMEDYYLWVRMLLNGDKFYTIQESLLFFRTDDNTYRRRGGLRHGLDEVRFQYEIYRLNYISFMRFIKNIGIRFTTRIMPNRLREALYQHFLRK